MKSECKPIWNADSKIIRDLNRAQKIIQSKAPVGGWNFFKQFGYTLNTVTDQAEYALHDLVDTQKIIRFRDPDDERLIENVSNTVFFDYDPNPTDTGSLYYYALRGLWPVQKQPWQISNITSSGLYLSLDMSTLNSNLSTSGNTKTITINFIPYIVSSGEVANYTLEIKYEIPTTTQAVNFIVQPSATYVPYQIISVSLDGDFSDNGDSPVSIGFGFGDLIGTSLTHTLSYLPTKNNNPSYPVIRFKNIPGSAKELSYDFYMKCPNLVLPTDSSVIPEQYHDVIELYAISKMHRSMNNKSQADDAYQEFLLRIEDMKNDNKSPERTVVMQDYNPDYASLINLGGNFPKGAF